MIIIQVIIMRKAEVSYDFIYSIYIITVYIQVHLKKLECREKVSINDHPYSINYWYLLFFETTIMGKIADLAMIQKMNIDTLHKEGKCPLFSWK